MSCKPASASRARIRDSSCATAPSGGFRRSIQDPPVRMPEGKGGSSGGDSRPLLVVEQVVRGDAHPAGFQDPRDLVHVVADLGIEHMRKHGREEHEVELRRRIRKRKRRRRRSGLWVVHFTVQINMLEPDQRKPAGDGLDAPVDARLLDIETLVEARRLKKRREMYCGFAKAAADIEDRRTLGQPPMRDQVGKPRTPLLVKISRRTHHGPHPRRWYDPFHCGPFVFGFFRQAAILFNLIIHTAGTRFSLIEPRNISG